MHFHNIAFSCFFRMFLMRFGNSDATRENKKALCTCSKLAAPLSLIEMIKQVQSKESILTFFSRHSLWLTNIQVSPQRLTAVN